VGIGSYGVVSNERESNLVGAELYGFSPQSPMESWTAARKIGTPGQLPDDPTGAEWDRPRGKWKSVEGRCGYVSHRTWWKRRKGLVGNV
jgi:hypothetical protein